jgi:hypothetical protein
MECDLAATSQNPVWSFGRASLICGMRAMVAVTQKQLARLRESKE